MATATMQDRLNEVGRHIDRLQERAKAAPAKAKAAAQTRLDALRKQEAAARAAIAEAVDRRKQDTAAKREEAEDQLEELETKVKVAEHALAADVAQDKQAFTTEVDAELHEWEGYFGELRERVSSWGAKAVGELQQRRAAIAEHLDALRTSTGESWQELRTRIDEERRQLATAVDEVTARLRREGKGDEHR